MSVSRVVALLTPLFAALAGYVAMEVTKLPGAPALDAGELTALFVAGAASATAAAVKWLHGRAAYERQASGHAFERDAPWNTPRSDDGPDAAPEPEKGYYRDDVATCRHPDHHPIEDREYARGVLGIPGLESDVTRALRAVASIEERLESPERAGKVAHHPV